MHESAQSRLQTTLERIDRFDAELGAFTEVLAESAAAVAARTDELAAGVGPDGSTSALWGLPIGVKELFEIAGGQASYGSEVLAGRRAPHDSTVVARLRAAGAIIVGSTRSHEFGWGITTQNPARGSTRNPWDLSRVPGGSSGGSAAAVAAGLVRARHRHRHRRLDPHPGRVLWRPRPQDHGRAHLPRRHGAARAVVRHAGLPRPVDRAPPRRARWRLQGRTPAIRSRSAGRRSSSRARTRGPAWTGHCASPCPRHCSPPDRTSAGVRSLDAVVAGLRAIGGEQVEVEAPDAAGLLDVFAPMQMAEALHVHEDVLGTFPAEADRYGADVRGRLEQAGTVDVRRYLDAGRAADELRTAMLRIFAMAPVLVTPVGSLRAEHDRRPGRDRRRRPDDAAAGRDHAVDRAAEPVRPALAHGPGRDRRRRPPGRDPADGRAVERTPPPVDRRRPRVRRDVHRPHASALRHLTHPRPATHPARPAAHPFWSADRPSGVQSADRRPSRGGQTGSMTAHYKAPGWFTRNVFNRSVSFLTRHGVSVLGSRVLAVKGRTSGEWRTVPVNLLELDGHRYLVSPRGEGQWVRNLRAAGTGELRVGKRKHLNRTS